MRPVSSFGCRNVDALYRRSYRGPLRMRLLRAALLCGLIDGLFSSVLTVLYGRTVIRLFQGIAATAFGTEMLERGTPAALLGLAMHFSVAFTWSAVLLLLITRMRWLSRVLAGPYGVIKVAAVYGPMVWTIMSMVVIPLLTRQPPSITYRWWIQFFGHIPFVATPIAWSLKPATLSRTT